MRTCGERRMYGPTEKISFLLTRGMANHEVLLVLAGSGSRVAAGGFAGGCCPEAHRLSPRHNRVRLGVEGLEERTLLSVLPPPVLDPAAPYVKIAGSDVVDSLV